MTEQERLARKALANLPKKVRGFYEPHFQLVPDTGDFVGLVCKVCNTWQEFGHADDCPVVGIVEVA